jgi:hypothetical protein
MSRHLADLRASQVAAGDHGRAGLRDLLARIRVGSATPPPAALDCCAA